MNLLSQRNSVRVRELSRELRIGEATIRRDLAKLEESGYLRRTHGGAVLPGTIQVEIPLSVRENERGTEKDLIAGHASSLISDGAFIIIDSSSTSGRMIPHLGKKKNLTVITNGAKTAVDLAGLNHVKVYSTGGLMREKSLSLIGSGANGFFNNVNGDILFFSCRALSMERGLTDFDEQEAQLRRAMMGASKKIVLLCDHSKFDETSFYRIGPVENVDTIVTDKKPSRPWVDYLEERHIDLIY